MNKSWSGRFCPQPLSKHPVTPCAQHMALRQRTFGEKLNTKILKVQSVNKILIKFSTANQPTIKLF